MDNEIERYRAKLQRKWDRRVTKRYKSGRRVSDYKAPPMWTWDFIALFAVTLVSGACMVILSGCASMKRMFGG